MERINELNQEDLQEARESIPKKYQVVLRPKELLYLHYLDKYQGDHWKAFKLVSPNVADENIKKNYKYLDKKVAAKVPIFYTEVRAKYKHLDITPEEKKHIEMLEHTGGDKVEAVRILNPQLSESYIPIKARTIFKRIERKDPHYLDKINERYNVLNYYDKIHTIATDDSSTTVESQRKASRDMIELLGHAQSKTEITLNVDHLDVTIDKLLNINQGDN
jgi:hypothetical protein